MENRNRSAKPAKGMGNRHRSAKPAKGMDTQELKLRREKACWKKSSVACNNGARVGRLGEEQKELRCPSDWVRRPRAHPSMVIL
eukprot:21274-Chlamydomonas_euryale.AAC.4